MCNVNFSVSNVVKLSGAVMCRLQPSVPAWHKMNLEKPVSRVISIITFATVFDTIYPGNFFPGNCICPRLRLTLSIFMYEGYT